MRSTHLSVHPHARRRALSPHVAVQSSSARRSSSASPTRRLLPPLPPPPPARSLWLSRPRRCLSWGCCCCLLRIPWLGFYLVVLLYLSSWLYSLFGASGNFFCSHWLSLSWSLSSSSLLLPRLSFIDYYWVIRSCHFRGFCSYSLLFKLTFIVHFVPI